MVSRAPWYADALTSRADRGETSVEFMNEPRPSILTTFTGEPVQPTRLQFRIARRPKVERVLRRLHCVFHDADRPGTRLWHYAAEAEGIDLPKRAHEIAKELQPVILADLSFPEPRRLVMRFRSPDRAIAAAKFFCTRFWGRRGARSGPDPEPSRDPCG